MTAVAGIVTDIEGTTTPIRFVHDTLFPYARRHLAAFLEAHGTEPEVAAVLSEVRKLAPETAPLAALRAWMEADAKVTPLKTLQGLIWRDAYRSGAVTGALYPDVAPALRRWHDAGMALAVYSSGSAEAQRLLFTHTREGDLTPLFSGFFDTRIGAKRDPASYAAIAAHLGKPPPSLLFLSDVPEELAAAQSAGFAVRHVRRAEDGTAASHFPAASSFGEIETPPHLGGEPEFSTSF